MLKPKRRKERGQALVEFALTLPVLLLVVLGILDFGRIFFTYAQASNSLRQALRQAPNIGFGTGTPSYRDCTKIEGLAEDVMFTEVNATVEYFLGNSGTPVGCSSVTDAQITNGDRMRVTTTAVIEMWSIPVDIDMEFIGQRTVVKTFDIGNTTGVVDTDFDGLPDTWELGQGWGGLPAQNGLGDYDCDGVTNGAEEALGTNPKTPYQCTP